MAGFYRPPLASTVATMTETDRPPGTSAMPAPRRARAHVQAAWGGVLCVVALDYLSTLAYQPSIAFKAAGRLAPLATVVVVLVTLLAALPVYAYVAGRSPHGGGAAALLERLVHGWLGKMLVLIVLG